LNGCRAIPEWPSFFQHGETKVLDCQEKDIMRIDLDRHRAEYHLNRLTVVPGVVDLDQIEAWTSKVLELTDGGQAIQRDDEGRGGSSILDGGGAYRHFILDGLQVRRHLPDLLATYEALKCLVAVVTHHDVTTSTRKYPRSAVNVKVYRGQGSQQGWHYDTNAITGLLYLTTNQEGATCCEVTREHPSADMRTKTVRRVLPVAGSLLIMQGRSVWHCAEPVTTETKIAAPLNYYTAEDSWRPEGIDNLVYGEMASVV
jgi:hypothetical protein